MSEAATSHSGLPPELQEYTQLWNSGLLKVLNQIAPAPFTSEIAQPSPALAAADESDLLLLVVCAGSLRGEMQFRLPRATVMGFGQLLLSEALDPAAEYKPEYKDAAEELVRQVTGQVATELKGRWGDTQVRVEAASGALAWAPAAEGWFSLHTGESSLYLEYKVSAALSASLRPVPATAAAPKEAASDNTLELLMDVELEASLRFGGRRMLLREILELDAGSVVELDRQVQQPADLLLDGKLIARGEVVVVGGHYGLRVTEVSSLGAAGVRRA